MVTLSYKGKQDIFNMSEKRAYFCNINLQKRLKR